MLVQMDVYEIRRLNLERLVREQNGRIVDLADRTGTSANYITQVLSDRTARHMGAAVARRIESKMDLPEGWMDRVTEATATLSPVAVDVAVKLDSLPESVRERIAQDVDVLYRYHHPRR